MFERPWADLVLKGEALPFLDFLVDVLPPEVDLPIDLWFLLLAWLPWGDLADRPAEL